MALTVQERAKVASTLLASLDSEAMDQAEIDLLWSMETQRRAEMIESGDARTFTRDEVLEGLADLRAKRMP